MLKKLLMSFIILFGAINTAQAGTTNADKILQDIAYHIEVKQDMKSAEKLAEKFESLMKGKEYSGTAYNMIALAYSSYYVPYLVDSNTQLSLKKDTQRSFHYLKKAINAGSSISMTVLGMMYAEQNNIKEALKWMERGCSAGEQSACQLIGQIPQDCSAGKQSACKRIEEAKQDCRAGEQSACKLLRYF